MVTNSKTKKKPGFFWPFVSDKSLILFEPDKNEPENWRRSALCKGKKHSPKC